MSVFTVPPFLPDPPDVKRLRALYEENRHEAKRHEVFARSGPSLRTPSDIDAWSAWLCDLRDHAATAADLATWAATEAARIIAEDRDDLVMLAYLDGHRVGRSEGYSDGYEAGAAYGHLDGPK